MLPTLGPGPYLRPSAAQPQTQVMLAIGQSNMVDYSTNDATIDWPANALVFDTRTDSIAAPVPPLYWLETNPANDTADWETGPGQLTKHFAIDWCAAHPADTLIVVPAARGASGFDGDWMADGTGRLYSEAERLLDTVFATHPGAHFLAVLAQHGERDGSDDNRCYEWMAAQLIGRLRDRYAVPDLPVIWGEPGPAAQFTGTATPGHDAVRTQIRRLPARIPHVATAHAANPAVFDALEDGGDGLHFDRASQKLLGGLHHAALAAARTNVPVTPDVAFIWQTAGLQGWSAFDIPCHDIAAGDRLVVLAAGHKSAGDLHLTGLSANGTSGTVHLAQTVAQTTRIGLSVASVLPATVPDTALMPLSLSWANSPSGCAISVWRIRGGAGVSAGAIAHHAALGPMSCDLTDGLPGTALMLAYAVDTGGPITFTGDGLAEAEGPGGMQYTHFSARSAAVAGETASLSLTPSTTPSHACGMVAVAVPV